MSLIFDWIDKIKRYVKFNPKELRAAIITILVISFAVSFRKWGIGKDVDFVYGLINFLGITIVVAVSFFGRIAFQKVMALGADLKAEYKMWSLGILLTLLLVFLTNGKFWFLIPGGIIIHYLPGHRLGWVRYGLNYFGIGVISLFGPIANIILAMIFRTLYEVFNVELFYTAFLFNIIWAIWSILPIPPSDGSRMFFGSRPTYMLGLAIVVSSAILLYSKLSILITIPLSIIIGVIWWLIYYILWERFNWKGPY